MIIFARVCRRWLCNAFNKAEMYCRKLAERAKLFAFLFYKCLLECTPRSSSSSLTRRYEDWKSTSVPDSIALNHHTRQCKTIPHDDGLWRWVWSCIDGGIQWLIRLGAPEVVRTSGGLVDESSSVVHFNDLRFLLLLLLLLQFGNTLGVVFSFWALIIGILLEWNPQTFV